MQCVRLFRVKTIIGINIFGIVAYRATNGRAAKLRLLNFLSLFRDLQKPTRLGGGGRVVAEFFRDPQKPTRFGRGGG